MLDLSPIQARRQVVGVTADVISATPLLQNRTGEVALIKAMGEVAADVPALVDEVKRLRKLLADHSIIDPTA